MHRSTFAGLAAALTLMAGPALAQIYSFPIRPLPVLSPEDFLSITAGASHTCATKRSGKTYCWGRNDRGQVGFESLEGCGKVPRITAPRLVITASQVEAGAFHTCALDDAGKAFCWGDNGFGQLGTADGIDPRTRPTAVAGGRSFTSLGGGTFATCATSASGMYCWGQINASAAPGLIFGWPGYQNVTVGDGHACAGAVISGRHLLDCWGVNAWGQTGVDPAIFSPVPPTIRSSLDTAGSRASTSIYTTCADQAGGFVQCVGTNQWGQLGGTAGSPAYTAQAQTVGGCMALSGVSVGHSHACALDPAGRAWCWGNGYSGQLGNAASGVWGQPQPVQGGRSYRAIAAGSLHTCAIGTDNAIYCWGVNVHGQAGIGIAGAGYFWTPQRALSPV